MQKKTNQKEIEKLQHDNSSLNEHLKMLQYKMDGIADQTAKLAIQEDGIVNALDFIFKTVEQVAASKGVPMNMPEEKKDNPGVR